MIKSFLLFILLISTIPTGIATYEYFYIERDYVFSRGLYMPYPAQCEDGVLYQGNQGAVFNKDGSPVKCQIVTMLPSERSKK